MQLKLTRENVYIAVLLPLAAAALGWAVLHFPAERADWRLCGLTIITVFCSSFMRIQLPRTQIHVTTSDAAIILALLWYGGETAVILALLETAYTSLSYRRKGGSIRPVTIFVNVLIAVAGVGFTILVMQAVYGEVPAIDAGSSLQHFISVVGLMTFSLFFVNSTLVSFFFAAKNDKPVLTIWTEYCLNALILYLTSAVLAGFTLKAYEQINIFLFAAVLVFFATVYFTYRRYVHDIKRTADLAELSERERAEQAEVHVRELQHYVRKLEQSGDELRASHERLRHSANHDALTGLPNRSYFLEEIKRLIKDPSQSKNAFAVLYLDLNRFKTINDSVGHSRGDRLIRQVATRLTELVGARGIVGRFSGDEFAILLRERTAEREAVSLARKVGERLSEPFHLFGREVFTSASIGIAYGSGYKRAENVLRDADIAMYHAKDTKQKYVVFDRQMHSKAVNLMQLETDLRVAIERKEFEVLYQPIVSLNDLSLAGFESLVRWNHPQKGVIGPAEVMPVCESADLIVPLTLFILEESCRRVRGWNGADGKPLFVSVNLSGKHFDNPGLVGQVRRILSETELEPERLKLEITETVVMENGEAAVAMLGQLKALGVEVSIDDFGTGYSSLNYLHRFPIDTLKIDRSFVSPIDSGNENGEIIRTIVYLAKALNLNVVAEGIESISQLKHLQSMGCEYGQGFLFSRPMPRSEIERMLGDGLPWAGALPVNEFTPVKHSANFNELPVQ